MEGTGYESAVGVVSRTRPINTADVLVVGICITVHAESVSRLLAELELFPERGACWTPNCAAWPHLFSVLPACAHSPAAAAGPQELQTVKIGGSKAGTARYTVPPLPHEVFRRVSDRHEVPPGLAV